MQILVAEDEQDLRELLKDNLTREGHMVFIAENGETACNIFNREPIELCILDVMVPEVGEFELVERIRTRPIIALSIMMNVLMEMKQTQ